MHSVSPALRRWSSAILWSIRFVHSPERRAQSRASGHAVGGKLGELLADVLERQADLLGENDEGDTAQHRPWIAAMTGARPLRRNEAALLVEAQRRGGDAAAPRNLVDGQHGLHVQN